MGDFARRQDKRFSLQARDTLIIQIAWENKTSKSFEFEREKFETLKIQAADLLDSKNELIQPFYLSIL